MLQQQSLFMEPSRLELNTCRYMYLIMKNCRIVFDIVLIYHIEGTWLTTAVFL